MCLSYSLYFPSPLWICVKGDHLNVNQGRQRGKQWERNRQGRRTKAIKGQEGVTLWPNFPLLTIQAFDVLIHLSLIIPSSLPPIWPSCILSFYIICFLSYHSFILLQVLKSSLVFRSSCWLFCPLWGLFQANLGRQPVVDNREPWTWPHPPGLCSRGTFCFGLKTTATKMFWIMQGSK